METPRPNDKSISHSDLIGSRHRTDEKLIFHLVPRGEGGHGELCQVQILTVEQEDRD